MRRRLVNVAGAVCLLLATILQWLHLRKKRDPWRHTAGLNLRGEAAKFTLTAFGLKTAREDFAAQLRDFLAEEKIAHVAVGHTRHHTRTIALSRADLTVAEFSPTGEMLKITPLFEQDAETNRNLIAAINATREAPVTLRAAEILKAIPPAARAGATRILQGSFLAFDHDTDRFAPPDPQVFRHPGDGLLNFVVRARGTGLDLWMQIHHTPVDGMPMQEMLNRFAQKIGRTEVQFSAAPTPVRRAACARPRGARDLVLLNGFFDFTALQNLRRTLNHKFNKMLNEPASLGAVLVWRMAQEPEFSGLNFAVVADIPADENNGRGVDFIVIQPDEFRCGAEIDFANYAQEFSRRLQRARARQSRSFRTMKTTALLPPGLVQTAVRLNVSARQRTFGTLGISLIKDAEVFLAPMGEVGFEHGFFGIGNLRLPAEDGRTVGSVSIKGEPEAIEKYPEALRRALAVGDENA